MQDFVTLFSATEARVYNEKHYISSYTFIPETDGSPYHVVTVYKKMKILSTLFSGRFAYFNNTLYNEGSSVSRQCCSFFSNLCFIYHSGDVNVSGCFRNGRP